MKSGMLAAQNIAGVLKSNTKALPLLDNYEREFLSSWAGKELRNARNFRPGFKYGLIIGTLLGAIDLNIFKGHAPWTLRLNHADHKATLKSKECKNIIYQKPDNIITFDRLTNLSFSGTNHAENQPIHLKISDNSIPIEHNLEEYDSPEQLYCPAGVYEIVEENNEKKLQINAQKIVYIAKLVISRIHYKILIG